MQGNPFGPFFTAAAQKVGAAKKHDGFDSSVVQVYSLKCVKLSGVSHYAQNRMLCTTLSWYLWSALQSVNAYK